MIFTLVYHTQPPEDCRPDGTTCVHNGTMYSICKKGSIVQCYDPATPTRLNVTVWAGLGFNKGPEGPDLYFLNYTIDLLKGTQPLTIIFNVCAAMDKVAFRSCGSQSWRKEYVQNHKYLCNKNAPQPKGHPFLSPCITWSEGGWRGMCDHTDGRYKGCTYLTKFQRVPQTNAVSLNIARNHPPSNSYGIGIDGVGADPMTYITIKVEKIRDGQIRNRGWSVYNTLQRIAQANDQFDISPKAENMFIAMAEEIAETLMVKNCFVCGGTKMGEQWPWEALEASPEIYNNMSSGGNITKRVKKNNLIWTLTTNLISHNCFT
ncbi:endogenous retrovirus group 3 member 1 Env polyprotein-like [Rhineura floridana]|uniref:endogenous retrovirus group 3 member 1 Env polyprotein-like n=1 Tax=Rhineura floridana TaxID=261503 RepID=UPI002AC86339|nr:endogenous retrovirus group 3 member 1 Env polyprotein-like [Rhineura floridana]